MTILDFLADAPPRPTGSISGKPPWADLVSSPMFLLMLGLLVLFFIWLATRQRARRTYILGEKLGEQNTGYNISSAGVGALIGLLAGYPLSYLFQAGAVRAKLSLGDYIQHIGDVLKAEHLAATAWGVWIGSVIVFALVGLMISAALTADRGGKP